MGSRERTCSGPCRTHGLGRVRENGPRGKRPPVERLASGVQRPEVRIRVQARQVDGMAPAPPAPSPHRGPPPGGGKAPVPRASPPQGRLRAGGDRDRTRRLRVSGRSMAIARFRVRVVGMLPHKGSDGQSGIVPCFPCTTGWTPIRSRSPLGRAICPGWPTWTVDIPR